MSKSIRRPVKRSALETSSGISCLPLWQVLVHTFVVVVNLRFAWASDYLTLRSLDINFCTVAAAMHKSFFVFMRSKSNTLLTRFVLGIAGWFNPMSMTFEDSHPKPFAKFYEEKMRCRVYFELCNEGCQTVHLPILLFWDAHVNIQQVTTNAWVPHIICCGIVQNVSPH